MTQDEIVEMAREAATEDGSVKRTDGKNVVIYAAKTNRFLERFAALVTAKEREACAKIVEDSPSYDWHKFACEAAAAIRARGQA
jgi:hypothetical protein